VVLAIEKKLMLPKLTSQIMKFGTRNIGGKILHYEKVNFIPKLQKNDFKGMQLYVLH